jgi:hypothetical protein
MSENGFDRLRKKIRGEYLAEGYSARQADYIARATAGKVAREKRARRRRHTKGKRKHA